MRGEHFYVHRVVAHAFLGPPPSEDAWQVNHKDGNRSNNNITNLEYVTCSQNNLRSHASGTRRCSGPALSRPVMYRALGTKDWTKCPSVTAAALELGFSQGAVSKACRRQTPLKGYEMSFADLHQPELPGEEWKQMLCPMFGKEVPGRMVSSLGRLRTEAGRIHRGGLRSGYLAGRYRSLLGSRVESVHRLVAFAFFGPPPSPLHTQVNHRDGDKQNNAVANLEYVTPAENMAHYYNWKSRTGQLDGKRSSCSKPLSSRAHDSNDEWTWHPSISSAAEVLDLDRSSISRCIRGIHRQSGGYEFRAADVFHALPGEEWREVALASLAQEKRERMQQTLDR